MLCLIWTGFSVACNEIDVEQHLILDYFNQILYYIDTFWKQPWTNKLSCRFDLISKRKVFQGYWKIKLCTVFYRYWLLCLPSRIYPVNVTSIFLCCICINNFSHEQNNWKLHCDWFCESCCMCFTIDWLTFLYLNLFLEQFMYFLRCCIF